MSLFYFHFIWAIRLTACFVRRLDIEHTDGKRYMTWDRAKFPTPRRMIEDVASRGRKMVTIVDPHVKKDGGYPVFKEAESKNFYVKKADGTTDFDGWCWPGSSMYLDVTSPVVRDWWAGKFGLDQYVGSTKDLYIWNDMNEPSGECILILLVWAI